MVIDPRNDDLAQAISLVTASQGGPDLLTADLMSEALADIESSMRLLFGLISLTNWLLVKVEKATGQDADEVLRDVARMNEQRRAQ